MDTNADREPYWTLIEVVTWIRTRDINQVSRIDPTKPANAAESEPVLNALPKRCRSGRVGARGRRCIWAPLERSQKFLAVRRRDDGQPSDVVEVIPSYEWTDLEWEPPVGGKVTGNLSSRLHGRKAWATVQFSRADIMREWPASESVEVQFDPQAGLDSREFEHFKKAPDKLIQSVIQKVYDDQQARGKKPPNIKELRKVVLPLLRDKGYEASGRRVEEIGSEPVFKKRHK